MVSPGLFTDTSEHIRFYLHFSFLVLFVGSVRQIKLTHVSLWLHVRIASDIVSARGCLPPGANVSVAAPANHIGNWYSYGYDSITLFMASSPKMLWLDSREHRILGRQQDDARVEWDVKQLLTIAKPTGWANKMGPQTHDHNSIKS